MENPVADIPTVIRSLTQSPPSLQETVLKRYFTNNASFVHPFCRVPNFEAFDEDKLKLYVNMSQIFSIWLVPFHVAPVTLTTVLDLTYDSDKSGATTNGDHKLYYISKQEDLYQTSEFVKFLMPHIGYWIIFVWHLIATLFCLLGVTLLWPILWLEEQHYIPARFLRGGNLAYDMGKKIPEIKGQ
ncbi:hypothetical protein PENFLA_c023G07018 [Penicillium flavigenum]|uniref:SigF-like NTF2-like domain-containing protein n=1 Tax=Penicillium flavigenum TaxID=254877 RepID=A0A1V6SUR5_9EURO|nr:hypothetical protein PENFLA_c023G07018 [Penicillium flavigenum]